MHKTRKDSTNRPDFIIIGAMKCATSTLHDQLALQPDFFMTTPKEPNFFSDENIYAKGLDWYKELFSNAKAGQLKGESSTHYTKQPTYPDTIERLADYAPHAKLIYVMRHPVDRLISHYIHEWTQGIISCDIDKAIRKFPELIEYSLYHKQLSPYLAKFAQFNILPLFAERLRKAPLPELEAIFRFLNVTTTPTWHTTTISNVSSERMRNCGWRDAIMDNSLARGLRRTFVPKTLRTKIRNLWTMQKRPNLSKDSLQYVEKIFDKDLNKLGAKLGFQVNCKNFTDVITSQQHINWIGSTND